jgi:hypothetical protein
VEPAQGLEVAGQAGAALIEVVRACGKQGVCLAEVAGQGVFAGMTVPGGTGEIPVGSVAQVAQAQWRLRYAVAVVPSAGARVEAVIGEQPAESVNLNWAPLQGYY